MSTAVDFSPAGVTAYGPRLAGLSHKLALVAWGAITLLSLLSFALGILSLNLWIVFRLPTPN